jgi:transposase
LEKRARPAHPLRPIRSLTNAALAAEFAAFCSGIGRPSVAPEMLLRAMLL